MDLARELENVECIQNAVEGHCPAPSVLCQMENLRNIRGGMEHQALTASFSPAYADN